VFYFSVDVLRKSKDCYQVKFRGESFDNPQWLWSAHGGNKTYRCSLPTVTPSTLATSTRTVSTWTTIPATMRIRISVSAPLGSIVVF